MNDVTKDLLEALKKCRNRFAFYVEHHLNKGDSVRAEDNAQFVKLANEAIARAEAGLAEHPLDADERRLRRMLCLHRHGGSAYMDDGEASFGGDAFQRPTDYMREPLDSIEQAWQEAGLKQAQAALAAPQPDADGWINPNDKTQKQYLPHIGEKVLFCHAGVAYYGKHTGGSFQSFNPPRRFGTWDCLWMYPPKAREAQP